MKEKKLNKYLYISLVLILVIGIISATYAFFQIDTNNSNSNATITANVDCFNITFEDISEEGINNLDINYPITDKYAIGQTENTDNLKPVVVKVSNKCTQIQDNLNYKLAITTLAKNTGYIPDNKVRYNVDKSFNEETKNTLSGPAYLDSLSLVEDSNVISLLKEEITNNKININEYKTVNTYIIDSDSLASNNTSTYYIKLWIDYYEGDKDAYIDPRNHIKGNEYDNSTQGQKFASVISLIADGTTSKSTIKILRENDLNNNISSDIQGGMYRYQGTDNVANWICFGTKDNCGTDETDSDGNSIPDGIDKYMYRIIGITPNGELYLLKETFIKEENVTEFAWNDEWKADTGNFDSCSDGVCPEWNQADLFQRINGKSNGVISGNGNLNDNQDNDTDIFVDSSEYDYLKSGDSNSGGEASEWYNLIIDHEWMYGDIITEYNDTALYSSGIMYAIETGKSETKHYVRIDGINTEQTYSWVGKIKAKISLMNIHDYIYSYYDGNDIATRGNPQNFSIAKTSWIHFQKNEYNKSLSTEWLSTRWGIQIEFDTNVDARCINNFGDVGHRGLSEGYGVRPVFYISSKVKIASGDGTKENPFTINIDE